MAFRASLISCILLLSAACDEAEWSPGTAAPSGAAPSATSERPARWAIPIRDQPGLPNLHKVSETLYRGAQPEEEGFETLKTMGIKTVINLRTLHSDRKECDAAGLNYVHITVQA